MKKLITIVLAYMLVLFLAVPPSVIDAADTEPSLSSQTQQEQDGDGSAGQTGDTGVPSQPEGMDETNGAVVPVANDDTA
ncbi:MAG: hypothetical protein LBK67_05230, partial [Coriobacteriales bacterium]|nr:hypothetical protein [Coriobacteriales bacterium]